MSNIVCDCDLETVDGSDGEFLMMLNFRFVLST